MFQEIRMAIDRRLASIFVLTVLTCVMLIASPSSSWAAGQLSNQAINQPASLVASEPDAKIAVYLRPEANRQRVGYGVNGDTVTVLEQVSDHQSVVWNHVRFDDAAAAEGWVQAEFLLLAAADGLGQGQQMSDGNSPPASAETRYLGNQRSPSHEQSQQSSNQRPQFNHQDGAQSYSQRNQN